MLYCAKKLLLFSPELFLQIVLLFIYLRSTVIHAGKSLLWSYELLIDLLSFGFHLLETTAVLLISFLRNDCCTFDFIWRTMMSSWCNRVRHTGSFVFMLIYNLRQIAAAYPGVMTLVVIMVFCIIRYYHCSLRRQSLNLQIMQNIDVN